MRKRASTNSFLVFHSSFLIVAVGFLLSGFFLQFLVFTSLIVIHEMGHFFVSWLLGVKVKRITIYPFGGITQLDSMVNLDVSSEMLIAMAGVIVQFLFYLLVCYFYHLGFIRWYVMNLYTLYNSRLIFFNLLPIYPLDGAKIVNLLLSKIFPFRVANNITIFFSFFLILILMIIQVYTYNYSNIIIYFLLIIYVIQFYQKREFLYYRFLLERKLYSFSFFPIKKINSYRNMYKDRYHFLCYKGKYMDEMSFLHYFL